MSYLSVPRIHFFGQFLASPSTVNNQVGNYQTTPAPAYPTYPPDVPAGGRVLWNPMGVAQFMLNGQNVNGTALSGCAVQSVQPADGSLVVSAGEDLLVGASIQTSNTPATAKIVDLDPSQQMTTELFGMQIQLVFADGTVGFSMKEGQFLEVPNLTDYAGSGAFESRIRADQIAWNPNAVSPLLQEFRDACQCGGISIKFLLSDYNTNSADPAFNLGTIIGALGPAASDEPARCSVGRKFLPQSSAFNSGYVQIDEARGKAVIDLSNSTVFNYVPGKSPELQAAVTVGDQPNFFGPPLDYSQQQYTLTAGIIELDISPSQSNDLKSNPFSIYLFPPAGGQELVLSEYLSQSPADFPTGSYVTVSQFFLRLSYSEEGSVDLIARQFGQPFQDRTFQINPVSDGLVAPTSVTTHNGIGRIALKAETPPLTGDRATIGSQLYFLTADWQITSNIFWTQGGAFLTVKAYPAYPIPENPTWDADVFPVMQQFMALYPGMKKIHDMSNYTVATNLSQQLKQVFSYEITDPRYMPVTRELNPAKSQMVLKWIVNGMPRS